MAKGGNKKSEKPAASKKVEQQNAKKEQPKSAGKREDKKADLTQGQKRKAVKAPVVDPEPSSEEEECPDLVPIEDEFDGNSEEGEFEYDEEGLAKHFLEMEAEEGEAEMDEYGEEEPDNEFIVPDD